MQISLTDRERRLLLDVLEELRDHSPIQSAPDARVVNELMQRLRESRRKQGQLASGEPVSRKVSQRHYRRAAIPRTQGRAVICLRARLKS